MPTAEEHLRTDTGVMLASLVFQTALLKGEIDRLKAENDRLRAELDPSRASANDHLSR